MSQLPRQCAHVMPTRLFCRAVAMKDQGYCYYHYRSHLVRNPEASSPDLFAATLPVLDSPHHVQAAIDQTVHAVASGQLELRRATVILRAIQLAAANLRGADGFTPLVAARRTPSTPEAAKSEPVPDGSLNDKSVTPTVLGGAAETANSETA